MTASLWKAFLVLLLVRQPIVARVNSILRMYCKGAVHKKGDKILTGHDSSGQDPIFQVLSSDRTRFKTKKIFYLYHIFTQQHTKNFDWKRKISESYYCNMIHPQRPRVLSSHVGSMDKGSKKWIMVAIYLAMCNTSPRRGYVPVPSTIGTQRLINLEISVLVRSLKSSNVELG